MNRISALALATVVLVATSTALVAQQPVVKATIPFNFTVGDQSMPAGEYIVSAASGNIVQIQSADRRHVGLAISLPSTREPAANPALVFDKYGEYYFLRRILCRKNTALNLDVAGGSAEKRVRMREVAQATEGHVLVAAR